MGFELDLSNLIEASVFLIMMILMECYRFICKTLNSRKMLFLQIKSLLEFSINTFHQYILYFTRGKIYLTIQKTIIIIGFELLLFFLINELYSIPVFSFKFQ